MTRDEDTIQRNVRYMLDTVNSNADKDAADSYAWITQSTYGHGAHLYVPIGVFRPIVSVLRGQLRVLVVDVNACRVVQSCHEYNDLYCIVSPIIRSPALTSTFTRSLTPYRWTRELELKMSSLSDVFVIESEDDTYAARANCDELLFRWWFVRWIHSLEK